MLNQKTFNTQKRMFIPFYWMEHVAKMECCTTYQVWKTDLKWIISNLHWQCYIAKSHHKGIYTKVMEHGWDTQNKQSNNLNLMSANLELTSNNLELISK